MANLTGDDGGNFIEGTDQADLIKGLGGDDLLFGEDGDDTVLGGDGDDTASLDRYDTGADLTFVVTDTTTSTTLVGDGSRVVDVENFVLGGGDGDDTFVMLDGDDRLSRGGGNDTLSGGGGNNTLDGDSSLDELNGGAGNDEHIGFLYQMNSVRTRSTVATATTPSKAGGSPVPSMAAKVRTARCCTEGSQRRAT